MPTKKIYSNTVAQIASKVITALISIVMIKILTTYLDVAGYGLYSKIYNFLSIFAVIADLGLYTITVRELSRYEKDVSMQEKIAANVLSLRTISGCIIIGLSLGIGYFLEGYNSPIAMISIAIASLFTLLGLINSSLMSYLQAILKTEFSIIANTSGKLLTLGIIVIGTIFWIDGSADQRLIYVMLAGLVGNLLMTLLTWWYASRWQRVRFEWDFPYIKHIVLLALPYGVALFLGVIFFKIDIIFLSIMEDSSIADTTIALYALPMKIVEVGMLYGTVFLNSLLPVLTLAFEGGEKARARMLIKKGFLILFFGGLFGSLFCFFMAEPLLRMISTPSFVLTQVHGYNTIDVMHIVGWVFVLYAVSSLFTYVLIAKKEEYKMLFINLIVSVINIVGNWIYIPQYSLIGAAWVTLASQLLLLVMTVGAVWWSMRKDV